MGTGLLYTNRLVVVLVLKTAHAARNLLMQCRRCDQATFALPLNGSRGEMAGRR